MGGEKVRFSDGVFCFLGDRNVAKDLWSRIRYSALTYTEFQFP